MNPTGKTHVMRALQEIPGVGPRVAHDLYALGIRKVADLKKKDPEKLYAQLCNDAGMHIDRCMLYVFRCAVYYATHTTHEPKKLNWWYWKDKK